MKIILLKGNYNKLTIGLSLRLMKLLGIKKEIFIYKQDYLRTHDVVMKIQSIYTKVLNNEGIEDYNPNVSCYLMATSKDFGDSFIRDFSFSTLSYELNYDDDRKKERGLLDFHSGQSLFIHEVLKSLGEDWRTNEQLIEFIETEAKKDPYINSIMKVVDVPDDVDWVIAHDDYADAEYIRENIVVREWH